IEGNREIVQEGEDLLLAKGEPFEQVARGRLGKAALLAWPASHCRRRVGGQADRQQLAVAGEQGGALDDGHLALARRRGILGRCPHLAQERLELAGPSLVAFLFNGVVTNDKFCWTRFGRLSLSFWRRPLRLRAVAASGAHSTPSETAMQGLGGGSDAPQLAGPATGPAA